VRDAVLGQEAALDLLDRMRTNRRVPHALCFQGPEGVGKSVSARRFAASLLCESGCDAGEIACESCRLIEGGNHPDLLGVRRLPKKPNSAAAVEDETDLRQQIVVDQIRELARVLALSPRRGRRRVAIVDPADRMNREAQNALLKTLEEPPGDAVLILVASRPHLLLPTVRSRCFAVGFAVLRVAELASRLADRGMDRNEALTRAALAEGRPGRALELDLDGQRDRREGLLTTLESLSAGGPSVAELPDLASSVAGRNEDELVTNLEMLEVLLRDAARASLAPDDEALVHADVAERLTRLGQRLGNRRASELTTAIERLRRDLNVNVNRSLAAETILAAVAGGPLP
jgi:DNA polymerase-3 subunit delta'